MVAEGRLIKGFCRRLAFAAIASSVNRANENICLSYHRENISNSCCGVARRGGFDFSIAYRERHLLAVRGTGYDIFGGVFLRDSSALAGIVRKRKIFKWRNETKLLLHLTSSAGI